VLSEEASEPAPAVVPAKLDANAGPAAAASSAKDNETERSFIRAPEVGGLVPRWAQTNCFQAATVLSKSQLEPARRDGSECRQEMDTFCISVAARDPAH
jgi:hypothetical protein